MITFIKNLFLRKFRRKLSHVVRNSSLDTPQPLIDHSLIKLSRSPSVVVKDEGSHELTGMDFLQRPSFDWTTADWNSLASFDLNKLRQNPRRTELALFKGAALIQTGNTIEAKQIFKQAVKWGCDKRHIEKIIIAGIHNSLGRALLNTQNQQRASYHFESSSKLGMHTGLPYLQTEITPLPQAAEIDTSKNSKKIDLEDSRFEKKISPLFTQSKDVRTPLDFDQKPLLNHLCLQQKELEERLEKLIRHEAQNVRLQLESFIALTSYLNDGQLAGDFHGFPISPDIGLYMVGLLEEKQYDLIIEFGSGTSTTILAKAAQHAARRRGTTPPKHIAFEHLEKYFIQTKLKLEQSSLLNNVDLQLTPLRDYTGPNDKQYKYYDCDSKLAEVSGEISGARILVIVDGPPGSVCKHSRYPAVPLVLSNFREPKLDILLDDYFRQEEKEIAHEWFELLESCSLKPSLVQKDFEKGACLISTH